MSVTVIGDNSTGVDYTGTDDTQIQSANPTIPGEGSSWEVTKYSSGVHISALIRLTGLSNIPSNAIIDDVTLSIYLEDAVGAGPHTISAYRLFRAWNETATWEAFTNGGGDIWGTNGALNTTTDRSSTVSGTTSVSTTPGYFNITGAQLIADVQAIVNSTNTNEGWILERTDGADDTTYRQFTASEGTDGQRPKLTVTWHLPSVYADDALLVIRKA